MTLKIDVKASFETTNPSDISIDFFEGPIREHIKASFTLANFVANGFLTLATFLTKPSVTVTSDSHGTVRAFATLGDATQIGSFLFISFGQGK
jgi:hypothetical protein